MSRAAYFDLLQTIAKYAALLQRSRRRRKATLDIIKEMQFIGMFNHKYRERTAAELNALCDDLYIELNA
jgi:hypothetical protein